ncbi:UNVERIFIED_CONTAM: hypothetical protein FKN15_058178 [Acipenser sinensis]
MPVVWPTLLDLNRDECKRILRKLGKSVKPAMSSASISSGEIALTSLLSASQPQSMSLQRAPQQAAPQSPVMVKSIPASSALAVTRFVKQVSGAGAQAQAQQTVVQVIAVKPPHTPQLPKLQQAPSSQNRPIHTVLSQPPPLQAHHPVSSDKPSMSQVQQPIITQGATVTKITFGSHQPATISKPASGEAAAKLSPVSSTSPAPSSEKSSVSDILKISMLEAQIDPSVEPMVVDSSSDCTFSKGAAASQIVASGQLISSTASPVVQSSQSKQLQQSLGGAGTSLHGQFTRIQNLPAQKSKEVDIIQVIPQYSITPDSSQSNVIVEPSGFLEITNFTSQSLEEETVMEQEVIPQYSITPDSSQSNVIVEPSGFLEITNFTSQSLEEETVMEQEVDSSNDEGMEASPSQSSIDQSQ